MENRLKERLTGAAILVALIVMLVPEMFHGQRGDVAAVASSSGEGPPVRSYTIDLSNSPTRTGPLQSTAVSSSGSGTSEDDKPASAAQPEQPSPAASPAPDATVTASPPAEPAAAPAKPAVTAPRAQPPAAAIGGGSHVTPVPAHSASQGVWAVQLGLFAKRDNAERLAHSAQIKGFAVSVASADAKGLYRVYAGGMAERAAAEAYAQRLKQQGLPAAVIAAP
jgi:DedD protein